MTAAVLSGLGGWLPPRVVTNEEVGRELGVTDEWIRRRTGIGQRHVCDPGTSTSDLAVRAGARALASAGVVATDAVVLATATPDHQIPGTAPAVAARLGMTGAIAFDVNAVCTGFVYALATGAALVRGGLAETVLVIGADTFSTVLDPADPVVRPLFGDGAGAVVLRAGTPEEPGALNAFDLGSDGRYEDFIIVPSGGSRQRSGGRPTDPAGSYMTMRGREVFRAAVSRMAESSRTVLAEAGRDVASVDRIVGHQANIRILRAVADRLDLPEDRLVSNIDRVGNTSAASIPLALADGLADGGVKEGAAVLLTAFGAGLTWGSTVLEWPEILLNEGEMTP
ncbi:beta-ketoacyl-ACP synthase III [Streptomyces bohaiensis]|uniref:Beta-ketoacyl-[acyl-carrier-protein] synthase III n=1 Tax=Streptomyces bohaiensis TaxID=1431344 RepID=A0ABX1C3K8_9ACTN|nr:beta-ketoacyl-ACP synthase III [Streptomyces bohaiensis]NJQ13815.1 ketoacyl-ACP synthase III [Streptomyces bohaiensis]